MFPERKYYAIYGLIIFTNILINLDHGIIPAATLQIEESLNLSNDQLGLLGSLVYAGIVSVGLFGGRIFLKFNAKSILTLSYMGMIVTLWLFTWDYSRNQYYYLLRFLTGAAQAPMLIYFPVWVDNFGLGRKTLWMTMLQGVIPLGIFFGYVISSIVSTVWGWQYSFYAQSVLLVPCLLLFQFISSADFDVKKKCRDRVMSKIEDDTISIKRDTYCSLFRELLQQKIWLCLSIGISILYFIVTGIQFWISNYMETVLGQPKDRVNLVFSIVSITAPVLGCIIGGSITQCFGGYESGKALYICVFYCFCACIVGAPIPFIDTFWLISLLIWLLLFFGGALVPPLTGIMLSSVPHKLKAFANSHSTTIYNLLGFLPAPIVYGYLSKYNPRGGLMFMMFYPNLGLILLLLCIKWKKEQKSCVITINDSLRVEPEDPDEKYDIAEGVLEYNDIPLNSTIAQRIFDVGDLQTQSTYQNLRRVSDM